MARVTVEDCLEKVDNRFALVLLAARRTRQLLSGARPLVEGYKNKESIMSLREIADGKVYYDRTLRDLLVAKTAEAKAQAETLKPAAPASS